MNNPGEHGLLTFFINNPSEHGLLTSRGCRRCKASAREAVVFHRERAATQQMRWDRLAAGEKCR